MSITVGLSVEELLFIACIKVEQSRGSHYSFAKASNTSALPDGSRYAGHSCLTDP